MSELERIAAEFRAELTKRGRTTKGIDVMAVAKLVRPASDAVILRAVVDFIGKSGRNNRVETPNG